MVRPIPGHVGALSVAGGALWLSGFGLLMTVPSALPVGYVSAAVIAMASGAVLLGAAVRVMLLTAETRPALRALGFTALMASGTVMLFALAALAVIGDEDLAWGFFDPELIGWWGLSSFMGAMALVTAIATPWRASLLSVALAAAILGAGGQAIAFAVDVVRATSAGPIAPLSVVLFGGAWVAVGVSLLSKRGLYARDPRAALARGH